MTLLACALWKRGVARVHVPTSMSTPSEVVRVIFWVLMLDMATWKLCEVVVVLGLKEDGRAAKSGRLT